MTVQEELDRIFYVVHHCTCRHLLSLNKILSRCIIFDILPNPGGYCLIRYLPTYPLTKPKWTVLFRDTTGRKRSKNDTYYPINIKSITEAFIISVFIVARCFGVKMPPDIIKLNPIFFNDLKIMISGKL
ncbi:unnamed protein product [Hymenolepis diminuta]|uniref:Uncharacterized protein n=1 Tax=Hymenolepis diminuta TaxID=6216 RepID=A0A564ZB05_HYMDI|nr:unnamed protein product [Hymenolepis diminuta]